ncbi:MAG TPA: hypothetical protein VLS90_10420 [Thermodesulfobacteriota bacterium]|nr:hypothetical protein [Thermodesulfobacteriota bacterium]
MSFLVLSSDHQPGVENLIKGLFSEQDVEIYRSMGHLSERLRRPVGDSIGVLAPRGREELLEILERKDLLQGIPTVVIAPDEQVETISIAHRLRPRFVACLNGNMGDLAAVLRKMAAVQHEKGSIPS